MNELQKAYHMVLCDMLLNGPNLFKGTYDAINGNEHFMWGIQTVMEYIAFKDCETVYEQFSDNFNNNILESWKKATKEEQLNENCYNNRRY